MKIHMNRLLGRVAILGVALASAGPLIAATPDDSPLAQRVEQALGAAQLRNAEVKVVVVTDGRIELQGWVNAPNDVLRAMKVASAVPGVESVASNLRTWRSTERYF